MTAPHDPTSPATGPEILGPPEAPARARGKARTAAVVAGALLAVGVAGGAVYAVSVLRGGGAQPEDVLPAGALGFVKVDLDPSAGQKLAAYNLLKKFPDSKATSQDNVKDDLLRAIAGEEDRETYDRDVKPWLGDRAGLAFFAPTPDKADEPVVVAAVQYTDKAKAEAGLRRLGEEARKDGEELHTAFAADGDYVFVSDRKDAVDRAVAKGERLAASTVHEDAVEALDGDQIVLGWADVTRIWETVPEKEKEQIAKSELKVEPSGLVAFGAHVEDSAVEMVGRTVGLSLGDDPQVQKLLALGVGSGGSARMIEQMPAKSVFAFSVGQMGEAMAAFYDTLGDEVKKDEEFQAFLKEAGVRLPEDLRALFGSEFAVGLVALPGPEDPQVAARVRTDQGRRATDLIKRMLTLAEDPETAKVEVRTVEDGYVVGFGRGMADQAAKGGGLGGNPELRRALPDLDKASGAYFFDIQRTIELAGPDAEMSEQARRNTEPLRSFGYTASIEGEGKVTFRARLTVKE